MIDPHVPAFPHLLTFTPLSPFQGLAPPLPRLLLPAFSAVDPSLPALGAGLAVHTPTSLVSLPSLPALSMLASFSASSSSLTSSSPSPLSSLSSSASAPPPPSPSTPSSPPPPVKSAGVKRRETGLKHMVAGSIAGMAAKTILQPLDLIKVRLQVQDGRGSNEYRGVINAVQRVVREEGVLGLYRGLTPNLMAAGVSWGTYFFSYNQFKDFFKRRVLSHLPPPTDPSAPPIHIQLGPLTHLACAAASGTLATTLTNPIVLVKTRLQLQGKEVADAKAAAALSGGGGAGAGTGAVLRSRPYTGMLDAFGRIVREEGFLSLYRGLGPSLVLVSNGSLQFMAYEELKELCIRHVVQREEALKSHHYFLMGGLAKIFSATVTYPLRRHPLAPLRAQHPPHTRHRRCRRPAHPPRCPPPRHCRRPWRRTGRAAGQGARLQVLGDAGRDADDVAARGLEGLLPGPDAAAAEDGAVVGHHVPHLRDGGQVPQPRAAARHHRPLTAGGGAAVSGGARAG